MGMGLLSFVSALCRGKAVCMWLSEIKNFRKDRLYMEEMKIRLLKASEIECRISMVSTKGVSLLLYKDARVDQRILDETFGMFGWKRSHQLIDGNLYCTVEVLNEGTGEWVSKQDVGTMGYTEKEKSQASDSFKRACFNWGIGRELYSAPFIWIPADKVNITRKGDKLCCYDRFFVTDISYSDTKEIEGLVIENESGEILYSWKTGKQTKKKGAKASSQTGLNESEKADMTDAKAKAINRTQLTSLYKELSRTGVSMEEVKDRYKFDREEELSPELYKRVMAALANTINAA